MHNTTRFVVLSAEADDAEPDEAPVITTFIFRVRNVPAALYKALGGFATNGVNMTKLESYQLEGTFNATMFFADIEGHPVRPHGAAGAGGAVVLLLARRRCSAPIAPAPIGRKRRVLPPKARSPCGAAAEVRST